MPLVTMLKLTHGKKWNKEKWKGGNIYDLGTWVPSMFLKFFN